MNKASLNDKLLLLKEELENLHEKQWNLICQLLSESYPEKSFPSVENPLTAGKEKQVVGTCLIHEFEFTRKIECRPIKPLKGDTNARMWLVNQLKEEDYKILEDGGLLVEIPKKDKYGHILNKVAWCFQKELEEVVR